MYKSCTSYGLCFIVFVALCYGQRSEYPSGVDLPLPTTERPTGANGVELMGILHLPDGSKFQTTLYELKVIGQLRSKHKLPYYILSGLGCQGCDANVSIYVYSPSDGPMKDEGTQQSFEYPGRVLSREDRRVLSRSRMFYGECAVGHPNAVIWFDRYLGNDKRWHSSVSLAEIKDDKMVFTEAKGELPRLVEAEHAVQKSHCRELPGIDQWEEP
jgi:hypothetical protein